MAAHGGIVNTRAPYAGGARRLPLSNSVGGVAHASALLERPPQNGASGVKDVAPAVLWAPAAGAALALGSSLTGSSAQTITAGSAATYAWEPAGRYRVWLAGTLTTSATAGTADLVTCYLNVGGTTGFAGSVRVPNGWTAAASTSAGGLPFSFAFEHETGSGTSTSTVFPTISFQAPSSLAVSGTYQVALATVAVQRIA